MELSAQLLIIIFDDQEIDVVVVIPVKIIDLLIEFVFFFDKRAFIHCKFRRDKRRFIFIVKKTRESICLI